jgi:hypothetical protein
MSTRGIKSCTTTSAIRAQCDCCGEFRYSITRCWAYGIETFACGACRGDPEAEAEAEEDYGRGMDYA